MVTVLTANPNSGLDVDSAVVRLGGDCRWYSRLLSMFERDKSLVVRDIRQALQSRDFLLAQRLAHTLKSVAGTIGANSLSEAARQLEAAILADQESLFGPCLEQVEAQLQLVLRAIASFKETGC